MGRSARGRGGRVGALGTRRDYNPVSWKQYWDTCESVKIDSDDVFQVYRRGTSGPLLLLLHGGGYSALTWSLFAVSIFLSDLISFICIIYQLVFLFLTIS